MSQYSTQTPSTAPFGPQDPPKKSGMGGCFIGCGIFLVASMLICGGVGLYVYMNAKSWATDAVTSIVKEGIKGSEMREEDKTATIAEIDRVADGFKAGKITMEELGKIMEGLTESPLMSILMVYGMQEQYIENSGLTDEEKAAAKLTLQRVARGVVEKKITSSDLDPALSHVMETGPEGQKTAKESITDEDLRQCVAELKTLADDKQIAEGEFVLDVAKELRRVVDEAVPGKLP